MEKTRKVVAGAGTLMFAALITLASMLGTQWVHDHTPAVIYGMVFLTAGCFGSLAFWLFTRDGSPEPKPVGNLTKQETHGSNSPTVGGDIASIKTHGPLVLGDSAIDKIFPKQVPPPVTPPEKKRPNLICLEAKHKKDAMGFVVGAKQEKLLGLLPIENRVGDTVSVGSVCASIRFLGGDTGVDHYVKKAFWHGKSNYDIDIPIGDVESVVMGQAIGDRWYYFDNPMRYVPTFGRSRSWDMDEPNPEYITISEDGVIAELDLFNPHGGTVYLSAKFRISGDEQSGVKIERISETQT